jgi:hypothetical protein
MELKSIPGPDKEGPTKWYPIVRVGRVVPFGYAQDPNDPDILLPVEKELELLEQAKVHLKKYSLRNVAEWLSTESGRYISHVGLDKRVKLERKRRREAGINRDLIERLKKAIAKAERLEKERVGGAATFFPADGTSTTLASTRADGENAGSGGVSTESGASN